MNSDNYSISDIRNKTMRNIFSHKLKYLKTKKKND